MKKKHKASYAKFHVLNALIFPSVNILEPFSKSFHCPKKERSFNHSNPKTSRKSASFTFQIHSLRRKNARIFLFIFYFLDLHASVRLPYEFLLKRKNKKQQLTKEK